MAASDIKQNFAKIFQTLQDKDMNVTHIAKSMGYTTTAQIHSALKGDSLLSTKAAIALIDNFKINPTYLFLGKGEMFLTDESELETLKKEHSELQRKFSGLQDDFFNSQKELEIAVRRYNKLIDIIPVAGDKTQKTDEKEDITDKE